MIDQLLTETSPALHPDSLCAEQATQTLRYLMRHYASEHPPRHWATMVSVPYWREERTEMIRALAEGWLEVQDISEREALVVGEIHVLAIEALAAQWEPEYCRISTVRMNGQPRVSLVCVVGG
jgi:hypothetical protein